MGKSQQKDSDQRSVREQGFSVVELMIVVGIIGVLTAMASASYGKLQESAKRAEAYTMLNMIGDMTDIYLSENLEFPYSPSGSVEMYGPSTNCTVPYWAALIGFAIANCTEKTVRYDYTFVPNYPSSIPKRNYRLIARAPFIYDFVTGRHVNRVCSRVADDNGTTITYYIDVLEMIGMNGTKGAIVPVVSCTPQVGPSTL